MTPEALTITVAVISGVGALLGGLFFYTLKGLRGEISDTRLETAAVRTAAFSEISATRAEHHTFVTELLERMPRTYVLRDDYVRTMASVDGKLDLIRSDIQTLAQNLHDHVKEEG